MTSSAAPDRAAALPTRAEALAAIAGYEIINAPPGDPGLADLNALCELAATLAGVPTAAVNLIDDEYQHQVASYGSEPTTCRADEAICQTTLAEGHDVVLADASADPRFAESPWVTGRLAGIRGYCSTILRTPAGHPIGTLCVYDERPRTLSSQQVRALHILARHVVDVLELRMLTRQLAHSRDEIAQSQNRLAGFAGQISHDLKAPITAIIGFTELLQDLDTVEQDGAAAAYVGRCTSAARRMLAMVEDLLAFARVGGSLTLRRHALDTLLPAVLDDLGAAGADAEVSWSGPDVLADGAQLRALVQNLVGNCLIYRSERPCVVRVDTETDGQTTVLRVIDNGSGIPAESRADVLRPLVRLRKDVPGSGLGLAVCIRIVRAHGGTLEIGDTPGGGTTVTVRLPA